MDLSMIRGDDVLLSIPVVVTDDAQALTFTAKRALLDSDDDAILRRDLEDLGGVTIGEAAVTVALEPAETRDLVVPLTLLWDLEVVDSAGLTATVASGYLAILPDVTRDGPGAAS